MNSAQANMWLTDARFAPNLRAAAADHTDRIMQVLHTVLHDMKRGPS